MGHLLRLVPENSPILSVWRLQSGQKGLLQVNISISIALYLVTIQPDCENTNSEPRLTDLSVHFDGLNTQQFWETLFLDFLTGPILFFL